MSLTPYEWYNKQMVDKQERERIMGVEFLANIVQSCIAPNYIPKEIIEQAKEIEKGNIIEAWDKRCFHGNIAQTWHIYTENGEQYYNETYNK
ncbi:hypothetical protein UFOVP321_26 [uncultured Caudovirales phage]|uniref:Uncharacterized protein n=1 Tax=uncultured Caudovirales phage TaxID=2100421 RepID=A0A6J5M038_9CAUD|nr:hypothetical protein UFOVP321_26 [uncultured Caudovirales phage]